MLKYILTTAALGLLVAGPASAGEPKKFGTAVQRPLAAREELRNRIDDKDHDRGRGHDRDRDHDRGRGHGHHDDHDRDHGHGWRDDDHRGHSWRDDDRRDWRDHDWRRDDDWRRRGWHYHGWRDDGWRYYRWHDNRHWRYVPPYRYSFDFGYRSGYELAWRDWLSYGRYDRHWRRTAFYGYGVGYTYRAGYEAGWRDAAYYYGRGYRPDYWDYDPHGGWYFSFRIEG